MKNSTNFRPRMTIAHLRAFASLPLTILRAWVETVAATATIQQPKPKCLCGEVKVSCVQSDKTKSITKCIRIRWKTQWLRSQQQTFRIE